MNLGECCIDPRDECIVNPLSPDNAPRRSCLREYGKCCSRMGSDEDPGIESPASCPGDGRFSLCQGPLTRLNFDHSSIIGGDCGHHLRLQFRGLVLRPLQCCTRLRDWPKSPAERDLQRLREGQLATDRVDLGLDAEARRDTAAQRVARELGFDGEQGVQLRLEGFNSLRAAWYLMLLSSQPNGR